MKNKCSLWFQVQVLPVVVKKIFHTGSGKYPGSGSRGVKSTGSGSESAILAIETKMF
jgi:hypothetical protein